MQQRDNQYNPYNLEAKSQIDTSCFGNCFFQLRGGDLLWKVTKSAAMQFSQSEQTHFLDTQWMLRSPTGY